MKVAIRFFMFVINRVQHQAVVKYFLSLNKQSFKILKPLRKVQPEWETFEETRGVEKYTFISVF